MFIVILFVMGHSKKKKKRVLSYLCLSVYLSVCLSLSFFKIFLLNA